MRFAGWIANTVPRFMICIVYASFNAFKTVCFLVLCLNLLAFSGPALCPHLANRGSRARSACYSFQLVCQRFVDCFFVSFLFFPFPFFCPAASAAVVAPADVVVVVAVVALGVWLGSAKRINLCEEEGSSSHACPLSKLALKCSDIGVVVRCFGFVCGLICGCCVRLQAIEASVSFSWWRRRRWRWRWRWRWWRWRWWRRWFVLKIVCVSVFV